MTSIIDVVTTIYTCLLCLYPGSFKKEFQDEMLLVFSDMATDASRKGIYSLIFFCLRELVDFPINLLRTHLKEGSMFKIFRSQPMNTGLRSALGFGAVFAASAVGSYFYLYLSSTIESIIGRLQVFYFDLFHTEHGLELISLIPYAIGSLLTGLLLGALFAVLFADRSRSHRFILAGTLGWFLHDATGGILILSHDLAFFLGTRHYIYFSYATVVLSGAFLGLIFNVARSERREPLRLLIAGAFAYPLIAYLYLQMLFKLSIITTPWMFIALMILMIIYISSIFVLAIKSDGARKIPWLVVLGAIGYPLLSYAVHFLISRIYSPTLPMGINLGEPYFWSFVFRNALSAAIYGILFGLLLGVVFGLQKKSDLPQMAP